MVDNNITKTSGIEKRVLNHAMMVILNDKVRELFNERWIIYNVLQVQYAHILYLIRYNLLLF